jgi:hypothetical protein
VKFISSRWNIVHKKKLTPRWVCWCRLHSTCCFVGMFITTSLDTDLLDLIAYYIRQMANTVNIWIEPCTITITTENCRFGPLLFITGCDSVPSLFGIWKKLFNNVNQNWAGYLLP